MPRNRRLKGLLPRLLSDHRGIEGKVYRSFYESLQARYGPFADEVTRFEAGRVAVARLQLERSTVELTKAQGARRCGKGRKPNVQQVERLARRQGLSDSTYAAALRRLEELAKQRSGERDPLSELLAGRGH
jgi:hypothetical protein